MRSHRSLVAWKTAREISKGSLRAARDFWRPHASGLFGQLQRSALSIQLNIAEGYSAGGRPRFLNHLRIAYGSAVETEELLTLASEEALLPHAFAEDLLAKVRLCERLLLGLINHLRRTT